MDQPIIHAVIPAAGLGTRMLPLTRALPKEMLPLGRRPVIEHIACELQEAGFERVLVITGPRKGMIKNHLKGSRPAAASFHFKKQAVPLGLGHAVSLSKGFTHGGAFVLALGDTVIGGAEPASLLKTMAKEYARLKASAVIAVEEVPEEETARYGIVSFKGPAPLPGRAEPADGIIEKPEPGTVKSRLAVAARYVLGGDIFDAVKKVKPASGGEIQLTDALNILIKEGKPVYAWCLPEGYKRYDIGNFESYYKAFIDFSLKDEKAGRSVREYLKSGAL